MGPITITSSVEDDHVVQLAREIRQVDAQELRHLGEPGVFEAIEKAVLDSDLVAVALDQNHDVISIGGFVPGDHSALGRIGIPWLLATDRMARHGKVLMTESRRSLNAVLGVRYDHLQNVVWTGNKPSIRYLKRLGFTFGGPFRGLSGAELQTFYMKARIN